MHDNHPDQPLDIKIGSTAHCRDGRAGHVTKLVVAPGSKRLTHIVVERGPLPHRGVVVPIARVKGAQGDAVQLDMDSGDLDGLPLEEEIDFAVPDATWSAGHGYPPDGTLIAVGNPMQSVGELAPAWSAVLVEGHVDVGVPAGEVAIGRDTRVTYHDGSLGRLDHVLLDPTSGAVRALVVSKGHLLARDIVVPISWIETVGEDEIGLAADRALLEKLPTYDPARSDR
jgi:uncharacterized protein YrrD